MINLSLEELHKLLFESELIVQTFKGAQPKYEQGKLKLQRKIATNPEFAALIGKINSVDIIANSEIPSKYHFDQFINEEQIMKVLAERWKFPYKHVDPVNLNLNSISKYITREIAVKHLVLPVFEKKDEVTIAVCYEPTHELGAFLAQKLRMKIKFIVTTKTAILNVINNYWHFSKTVTKAKKKADQTISDPRSSFQKNLERLVFLDSSKKLDDSDEEVVKTVEILFKMALDIKASDIHIEPKRETCVIRMRVDGILHEMSVLPLVLHPAITTRIKITSGMNIAEKRRPQDGRLKVSSEGIENEFRVSTLPTAFGEKLVIRIFDADTSLNSPDTLGFEDEDYLAFSNFIRKTTGVIFLTGPTGSGKTTTLYSTLKLLSDASRNVVTIEDPIEMVYEYFNQVNVHPKIDLTFVKAIRAILRQDPDILMVGETRDKDTARSVIQAAITGHLVFSTLHTNDSVSALTRLIELEIEPFLISSAVVGIVAQRLVRVICPSCKIPVEATSQEEFILNNVFQVDEKFQLFQGEGCAHCRNTGYKGRTGIFECLPMSDDLTRLIKQKADSIEMKEVARSNGLKTLYDRGLQKVQQGVTSLSEVLRVTDVTEIDN